MSLFDIFKKKKYEDENTNNDDSESLSVSDAADIWKSSGKDGDYTFGYSVEELETETVFDYEDYNEDPEAPWTGTCADCDGSGRVECYLCEGEGSYNSEICSNCIGDGGMECPDCNGLGVATYQMGKKIKFI